MRTRLLIPAVALLALLAAAIPAFAQEEADDDAPPPSHSVELRVWQSVSDPLDGIWVSARADEDASWTTTALNIAMREGGGWRIDDLTVDALDGEIDLRLWQDPSDLRELWLSARPAGGSWEEYGTKRLDLDARSRSGRYRYDDVAVALEWPDAEPAAPGRVARRPVHPRGAGEGAPVHARLAQRGHAPSLLDQRAARRRGALEHARGVARGGRRG